MKHISKISVILFHLLPGHIVQAKTSNICASPKQKLFIFELKLGGWVPTQWMNCFVFKNQVGRRGYLDIRKCSEPQRTLQRCSGDQKPLGFSVAKAENPSVPCCIREKLKYAGHKVTFLLILVIIRLHLGQSWSMDLCITCSCLGWKHGPKNPSYPILKIFLAEILCLFNEYHLMTTGRQLTVSSRWTPSVVN